MMRACAWQALKIPLVPIQCAEIYSYLVTAESFLLIVPRVDLSVTD